MAKELNIEFLGSLPLDPLLARCCDEGKNFLTEFPQSPTIFTLQTIVQSKFLYICKICKFSSISYEDATKHVTAKHISTEGIDRYSDFEEEDYNSDECKNKFYCNVKLKLLSLSVTKFHDLFFNSIFYDEVFGQRTISKNSMDRNIFTCYTMDYGIVNNYILELIYLFI